MEMSASPKTASMTVLQYSITQVITMDVTSSTAVIGRNTAINLRLFIFFFVSAIVLSLPFLCLPCQGPAFWWCVPGCPFRYPVQPPFLWGPGFFLY